MREDNYQAIIALGVRLYEKGETMTLTQVAEMFGYGNEKGAGSAVSAAWRRAETEHEKDAVASSFVGKGNIQAWL